MEIDAEICQLLLSTEEYEVIWQGKPSRISRRFRPTGIGNWRRQGNSGPTDDETDYFPFSDNPGADLLVATRAFFILYVD
jgi:hypothetical protein